MKKSFLALAVCVLSFSAMASNLVCTVTQDGTLVHTYTEAIDAQGHARVDTDSYDIFSFGAVVMDNELRYVFSAEPAEHSNALAESSSISVTTDAGSKIDFSCDVL
jgi:hypothetical protein